VHRFCFREDSEREWAYDRRSHIGKLDKALDEAKASNWIVVSRKIRLEENLCV